MQNPRDHVTVVLNPNARKLKLNSVSVEDFRALLAPGSDVQLTQTLDELDDLMNNWKSGERTLCFYGGDGSISQGITSLIRHHGEQSPLPPVLPVRAGTMNMVCNLVGRREDADRTLINWNNGQMRSIREIPTLKLEVEGQEPRYGFVLAWGIGYRVLADYYRRTSAPNMMDAVAVATSAFMQAIRPWSMQLPLFRREDLKLRVNGEAVAAAPMHTFTAGTIPRLSLGMRPFPPGEIVPGTFAFSANGMPLSKVANNSPTLLFGLGDQRQLDAGDQLVCGSGTRSIECVLNEGYTMDGEIFELPEPRAVRISSGPVVRFWSRS